MSTTKRKRTPSTPSPRYCSFLNCNTNTGTSTDPRTNSRLKFHVYPNPEKERDRCLKWIINSRREDLTLNNIKSRLVCALHFEVSAYNCREQIDACRLLPEAVPTIVDPPNPPKPSQPKRKPPKQKIVREPKRARLQPSSNGSDGDSTLKDNSQPPENLSHDYIEILKARIKLLALKALHHEAQNIKLRTSLRQEKVIVRRLKQQNKRLVETSKHLHTIIKRRQQLVEKKNDLKIS